ncbi:hypothetical protein [Tardiphaga sp.]|uniref:hypothetical protein n=1 Tax=Tardiphaga sp. TaxID=1926292 RepID=UPI0026167DF5|nr:hypothetical protein [Tardiphaga sp.]MDB5620423.1 hypothetical protein [Tardiphaga sp.]
MKNPVDAYTVQARVAPAIIAGAPAFAFAAIFLSFGKIGLPHLIAGTALVVLFGVFSDVARRRGRAIEPSIVDKMGGLPTTVTLRHRDTTHDATTKAGFHKFFEAKLGQPAPSLDDEKIDPIAADAYYARGAAWLRENTRNAKKFDLLFNENVSYGFRRNLLGLKTPGFLLNAIIVIVCLAIFWRRWPVDLSNGFDGKLLAVIVIAVLHAAYLAFFVTEEGVFEAARIYARQLLLSTQSPHLNKPEKSSPAPRRDASRSRAAAKAK